MKKAKPVVGIYSLTSCEGCQVSILNLEEKFLQLCEAIDIRYFPLIKERDYKGRVDIAVVEGTVVRKEEIDTIVEIRKKAKYIIALGTCATYGGVASIRDFTDQAKTMKCVYPDPMFLKSIHNVRGQLVDRPLSGLWMPAGEHRIAFTGENLSPGIYYYRLSAGGRVQTRRMVFLSL